MKHYFTLILLLFSLLLSAKETVSVAGKITNIEGNELHINGLNFSLTIPTNPDGSFTKEFEIEHPGIYNLFINKSSIQIYLNKDIQLIIDGDANDFIGTSKISGKNIAENNYLLQKAKIYSPITSNQVNFYKQEEETFVRRIDSILTENQSLLKNTTTLDPKFHTLEEKHIVHGIQPYYVNYRVYHAIYTESSFSKAKLADAKVIHSNDIQVSDDEFIFSPIFRVIVNSKFNNTFKPKFDKKPALCKTYLEETFADFSNPLIQDFLLKNLSNDIRSNTEKDKYLFEGIIALAKDEAFINTLNQKMKNIGSMVNGAPAPAFELLDQNDQKVNLEDFRGKYIYIDFWATWCKPCIAEIPSLKKVEEKFKDKNIVFLSISIDNQKDVAKWKKFIADKELHGTQLIGDNGWESKISKDYVIQSVPRFVLIDTEGFLIDIDAPRPSDSKLTKTLNRLDKI